MSSLFGPLIQSGANVITANIASNAFRYAIDHIEKFMPYILALVGLYLITRLKHGYASGAAGPNGFPSHGAAIGAERPIVLNDEYKGPQRITLVTGEEILTSWGGIHLTTRRLAIESGKGKSYSLEYYVLDRLREASINFVHRGKWKYASICSGLFGFFAIFICLAFGGAASESQPLPQAAATYPNETIYDIDSGLREYESRVTQMQSSSNPLERMNYSGTVVWLNSRKQEAQKKLDLRRAEVDRQNQNIEAANKKASVSHKQRVEAFGVAAAASFGFAIFLIAAAIFLYIASKRDFVLVVKLRFDDVLLKKVVMGPGADMEKGTGFINAALEMMERRGATRSGQEQIRIREAA